MKRFISILLVLLSLVSISAYAEGKITVTHKNLIIYQGDDSGFFYARVENTGDSAVGLENGDLVVFGENDEILVSDGFVSTNPSYVTLKPGEYLYVREFLWDSALQNAEITDYKFSMPIKKNKKELGFVPCETTLDLKGEGTLDNYVYVTFSNNTEEIIYGYYVTAAMYDKDGNLIFVDSNSMSNVAIHPNAKVTVRLYVDNDLMEHYELNDIEPAEVDAVVCYTIKD